MKPRCKAEICGLSKSVVSNNSTASHPTRVPISGVGKQEIQLANFDESNFFNIAIGDSFFEGILVQLSEEGFGCRL